ncbi:MAG TPA: TPM domain-containing protein [Bacilli bacterium]|nr:TPM domain-containing protein [Bacilli bacterium]
MRLHRILILSLFLLSSCTTPVLPRSNAFYINDHANALLSSTEYLIYSSAKELYENDSQKAAFKSAKINGTQVVVATFMGEVESLDTTNLFNSWQIGDNDMGLLLLLYFAPNPADEYIPLYLGMTREIGSKLANYISMFRLEEIFIATWESDFFLTQHREDYDYKLALFYTTVIAEIYTKVYDSDAYNQESMMESYALNQYESYYYNIPRGNAAQLELPWWGTALLALGLLILLFLGGASWLFVFKGQKSTNKGAGGRSKGYKYSR